MKEHAENKMNEISENNSNLRKQRDSMLHCFKMLVERVAKEKKKDDEKFQQLVIISDKILKVRCSSLKSLLTIQTSFQKGFSLHFLNRI